MWWELNEVQIFSGSITSRAFPLLPLWKIFSITFDSQKKKKAKWKKQENVSVSEFPSTCFSPETILRFCAEKALGEGGWMPKLWRCEAHMNEIRRSKTKKDTREGKETLIIKIYVHNVVTCFFNFFSFSLCASTSTSTLTLSSGVLIFFFFVLWFLAWKHKKVLFIPFFFVKYMLLTLPSHSWKRVI